MDEMKLKSLFKGFKNGIKDFGSNISVIINSALLLIVYFTGVAIPGIISKFFGKHFLDKNISKSETYWLDLNLKKGQIEEYYRQF